MQPFAIRELGFFFVFQGDRSFLQAYLRVSAQDSELFISQRHHRNV